MGNAIVPLPEVTILRSWPAATNALFSAAVCAKLSSADSALPTITLEIATATSECGSRVPVIRLQPKSSANESLCTDSSADVLFVTRASGPGSKVTDMNGVVEAIGLPLDAEFFELLSSETAIRAIVTHLEAADTKDEHACEKGVGFFHFQSPEAMQKLRDIHTRLNLELNNAVSLLAHSCDDEVLQIPRLDKLLDLASDVHQARAVLGISSPLVACSDELTEPAAKRPCAAAAIEATAALERLAEKLQGSPEVSESCVVTFEMLAASPEENALQRCLRVSLQAPLVSALVAATNRGYG